MIFFPTEIPLKLSKGLLINELQKKKGCFTEVSLMVRTTFGIPVFNDNTGSPMNTLIFFSKMAAALSCVFKAAINDCLPRQIRPSGRTLNLIHKMRSFHRQYKKAAGQIKPNNTRITSTDLSLQDFMSSPEQKGKIGKEENIPYLREETFHGRRRKVYFETYGCQMNVNDTEIALAFLLEKGFRKTTDISEADVILLMTCSIRENAESKIWNRLKHLKHMKLKRQKHLPQLKIGILGCMAERLKTRLLDEDKLVDIVAGPDSYRDLPRLLAEAQSGQAAVNVMLSLDETYADVTPVRMDKDSHSAFVSIMRGCNNMCTYCIVPFTRGRERSRPIASIVDEVKHLIDQGVKEVTLLGQNVNSYRDVSDDYSSETSAYQRSKGFTTIYKNMTSGATFADLLDRVSQISPELRVRFTSPHPKDFPDKLLELIKERPNVCNQIHLPAQSGSTEVLESMRRGYTREAYLELVDHIRNTIPGVALSSDFIAGFCGETESQHQESLSLLRTVRYDMAYLFAYSMREKTRAHHRLQDDVPQEVKSLRLQELIDTFYSVAKEQNTRHIGTRQLVLVEGTSKKSHQDLVGRNDGNTKVIFPITMVTCDETKAAEVEVKPGDYVEVEVLTASALTLKAKPICRTTLQRFNQKLKQPK